MQSTGRLLTHKVCLQVAATGTQGCGMGVESSAAWAIITPSFALALCFTVLALALGVLGLRHGAALDLPALLSACD